MANYELLLLVYTLDIAYRGRYRPDLVHFSFLWKEKLRCCRHRAGGKQQSTGLLHQSVKKLHWRGSA